MESHSGEKLSLANREDPEAGLGAGSGEAEKEGSRFLENTVGFPLELAAVGTC